MISLLGAGGMGHVYRVLDRTLGREVAIKVLPDAFAKHPERLARFGREARVLASLNHPNIAVIHALEQVDDVYYLEMELIRGDTLEDRILGRGAIAITEVLKIFKQIAEALETAHKQNIVHRDLKPSNIMFTQSGLVKILDFGLAKVITGEDTPAASGESSSFSTMSSAFGLVVGTAAYMSPEQARGDVVDRRSDIWSFGCVLYEALTGQRAFPGRTVSDTIASVLKEDPDWSRLRAVGQPRLERLVQRCLQKDPHVRLHDIADARIEIEEILNEPTQTQTAPATVSAGQRIAASLRWWQLAAGVLLLAAGIGAGVVWSRPGVAPPRPPLARVMVAVPAGQTLEKGRFSPIALSPDGTMLVYAAAVRGGQTGLYLRRLDGLDARLIQGTEGANTPFFSPDGRWLAFYADGSLKKLSLAGGVPLTISDVPPIWGATWTGNTIVFATTLAQSGLWLVSANGGDPVQITTPKEGETQHGYPQILPDGTHVLFSITRGTGWQPALLSLADRTWRIVGNGRVTGEGAKYLPTGHLVSVQAGGLVATQFDVSSGELRGDPIPLLERVETSRFGGAYFAVAADTGALLYLPAHVNPPLRTLLRVDRQGRVTPLVSARISYQQPSLSPDGKRLAVTIASETGSDIWLVDLERGTRIRFTTDNASAFPVWSPDGSALAYQSSGPGPWNLYSRRLDTSSDARALVNSVTSPEGWSAGASLLPGTVPTLSGANPQFPMSWASNPAIVAFHERKANGERDIWVVGADGEPTPFVLTPFDERTPRFSPDGKRLAYVSNESGRDEVYVQPFPGPGEKWLVSTDGGLDPVWSRNGRELFYRQDDQIMVVSIATDAQFSASRPQPLFEARFDAEADGPNFDVSPDGQWFVMLRSEQRAASAELNLVLNWFSEITSRTADGKQ